jgi:murein endopeptidase
VLPHDDHFHVRIGCPARMSGCVENPAVHLARTPPQVARAHRLAAQHALVTPAPRRTPAPVTPVPAVAVPEEDAPPAEEPREAAPAPLEPPAVLSTPVDDVDG